MVDLIYQETKLLLRRLVVEAKGLDLAGSSERVQEGSVLLHRVNDTNSETGLTHLFH